MKNLIVMSSDYFSTSSESYFPIFYGDAHYEYVYVEKKCESKKK